MQSVSAWGGEDNDPPKYGKVIISLNPYDGYIITDSVKNEIKDKILQNKQVLSIMPEFVDPEYFYVNLSVNVKYLSAKTSLSATDIQNSIINEIQAYFTSDLQEFDKDFKMGIKLWYDDKFARSWTLRSVFKIFDNIDITKFPTEIYKRIFFFNI